MTLGHCWIRRPRPLTQIRTWARSLSGVTQQVAQNDPEFRAILQKRTWLRARGFVAARAGEADTADPAGEPHHDQPDPAHVQPVAGTASGDLPRHHRRAAVVRSAEEQPNGLPSGDFALTINDPPPCTVGFLPPSQWRSTRQTRRSIDTPDGLYCKLPQDSPLAVRGARNYPCMGHPGKRAPTVELCNDPRGYQPTAMRQHILGAYPIDPNLVAQGVPLDDRVDFNERIYAPVEGTPLPAGAAPVANPRRGTAGRAATAARTAARPARPPRPRPSAASRGQLDQRGAVTWASSCRRRMSPPVRPRRRAPAAAPSAFNGQRFWGSAAGGRRITTRRRASTSRLTVRCSRCRIWLPAERRQSWKDLMPF